MKISERFQQLRAASNDERTVEDCMMQALDEHQSDCENRLDELEEMMARAFAEDEDEEECGCVMCRAERFEVN